MKQIQRKQIKVYNGLEGAALGILVSDRYDHLEIQERLERYATIREKAQQFREAHPELRSELEDMAKHYDVEGHTAAHKLIDRAMNTSLHRHHVK
ncbi:MAG TPA: hypothetical protein VHA12_01465 [Candidatus Nanoarchaeia archaeon]|nr:hypothetical protein [Candidatus Nanoarchaeia archaeon]